MRGQENYMKWLKDARLDASLRNLERMSLEKRVYGRLRGLIEERRGRNAEFEESEEHLCIVALSGGADSTASLILTKRAELNPLSVTVEASPYLVTPSLKKCIEEFCLRLHVPHEFLDRRKEFLDIFSGALSGGYHPCGRCHDVVVKEVLEYAKRKDIRTVVFGDMLSCGSESVKMVDDVVRINLPAMLAMTKEETQGLAGREEKTFGCALLKRVSKDFPHMKRYSIARVLRETRAGVLSPQQTEEYIEDIVG